MMGEIRGRSAICSFLLALFSLLQRLTKTHKTSTTYLLPFPNKTSLLNYDLQAHCVFDPAEFGITLCAVRSGHIMLVEIYTAILFLPVKRLLRAPPFDYPSTPLHATSSESFIQKASVHSIMDSLGDPNGPPPLWTQLHDFISRVLPLNLDLQFPLLLFCCFIDITFFNFNF